MNLNAEETALISLSDEEVTRLLADAKNGDEEAKRICSVGLA